MRIGFPLMKAGERVMNDDFHRSEWIGSYDVKTNQFDQFSIKEVSSRSENSDLLSVLIEMDIRLVVCNKIKPMALKYFHDKQITVYKAQSNEVDLNVELLLDGQLGRFLPQMAEASSCGSSCSSCSSDSCSSVESV